MHATGFHRACDARGPAKTDLIPRFPWCRITSD
jgi:hypothetical protein